MVGAGAWPRVIVGLVLLGGLGAKPAGGADLPFKVIVHGDMRGTSIGREALSAVFLKKSLRWSDGAPAQPVDQSTQSAVREAFSLHVHRQPLAGVMKFWMAQISNGRGVPPPVKASDADIIAFVASKRGAVGYVTAGAPLPATVWELQVVD